MQLFPHQLTAKSAVRAEMQKGFKSVLLQMATGGGKTVVASSIIESAVKKNRRVLFIAHRRELIQQTRNKLIAFGVKDSGIIMASEKPRLGAPVQIASIQTLIKRELPPADLIIIDEAHRAAARSYGSIISNYPKAAIIGLTATPERLDGRGLDDMFEAMVNGQSIKWMIANGFFVQPECYTGLCADLQGVERKGDYNAAQLEARSNTDALVCDIITEWRRRASDRHTIVFASGIKHANHIADEFKANGITAEAVTSKTPKKQREAIFEASSNRKLQVLVNVGIAIEGIDIPSLDCCILARSTLSLTIFLQACGRVARPFPDKKNSIILDHAGCFLEHGLPFSDRVWMLEGRERKKRKRALLECEKCSKWYESEPKLWLGTDGKDALNVSPCCYTAKCLECDHVFIRKMKSVDVGELDPNPDEPKRPGDIGIGEVGLKMLACECPKCSALYTDKVPHGEGFERKPVATEDGSMIKMDEETLEPLRIKKEYNRLLALAKSRGYLRGFVWHALTKQFSKEALNKHLPRHTGSWWRGKA